VKWTIKIGTIHVSTMRTCSSCETWSSCDQKKADVTTFREPVKPREACDPREHIVFFFFFFGIPLTISVLTTESPRGLEGKVIPKSWVYISKITFYFFLTDQHIRLESSRLLQVKHFRILLACHSAQSISLVIVIHWKTVL
jgi:hypothetical protein